MGQKSRTELEKELEVVEHRITVLGELVERARAAEKRKAHESTTGWLMTLCEEEIGTLLAITAGGQARSCGKIAEKLEQAILLLQVDRKLLRNNLDSLPPAQAQEGR